MEQRFRDWKVFSYLYGTIQALTKRNTEQKQQLTDIQVGSTISTNVTFPFCSWVLSRSMHSETFNTNKKKSALQNWYKFKCQKVGNFCVDICNCLKIIAKLKWASVKVSRQLWCRNCDDSRFERRERKE